MSRRRRVSAVRHRRGPPQVAAADLLSRRSFTGLQRAAAILCISESTRSALNDAPRDRRGAVASRATGRRLVLHASAERDRGWRRQAAAGAVRRGRRSAARRQHDRSQADRHPAARLRRGARRPAVRAAPARRRAADRRPGRARARPQDRRRNRAAAVSGCWNAGGRVSARRVDAAHLGARRVRAAHHRGDGVRLPRGRQRPAGVPRGRRRSGDILRAGAHRRMDRGDPAAARRTTFGFPGVARARRARCQPGGPVLVARVCRRERRRLRSLAS